MVLQKKNKGKTKQVILNLEKRTCTYCSKTVPLYKMTWILYSDGKYRVLDLCNCCYSNSFTNSL